MQVNSIGVTQVQSSSGDQGSIATLERQRDQILKKIRDLNEDKTTDAQQKQQELAAYQQQLQLIESQIQQIQAKQAAQAKARAEQKQEEATPAEKADGSASIHVVA